MRSDISLIAWHVVILAGRHLLETDESRAAHFLRRLHVSCSENFRRLSINRWLATMVSSKHFCINAYQSSTYTIYRDFSQSGCDKWLSHLPHPSVLLSTSTVRLSWDGFGEPRYLQMFTEILSHILSVQTLTWTLHVTGLYNKHRRVFSVKYEHRSKKRMAITTPPVLWEK
jgi:hypothetical protein